MTNTSTTSSSAVEQAPTIAPAVAELVRRAAQGKLLSVEVAPPGKAARAPRSTPAAKVRLSESGERLDTINGLVHGTASVLIFSPSERPFRLDARRLTSGLGWVREGLVSQPSGDVRKIEHGPVSERVTRAGLLLQSHLWSVTAAAPLPVLGAGPVPQHARSGFASTFAAKCCRGGSLNVWSTVHSHSLNVRQEGQLVTRELLVVLDVRNGRGTTLDHALEVVRDQIESTAGEAVAYLGRCTTAEAVLHEPQPTGSLVAARFTFDSLAPVRATAA
ncbi:hypothetical protein [Angustibacter sp. Root456]|uniref:hypothetical protein n=1 Tax=Angustibacter sp. Root456 TaxID=1736539 RepID=UPI0012F76B14|nr:hypothetical protein [Angustibacter sp. Root456]